MSSLPANAIPQSDLRRQYKQLEAEIGAAMGRVMESGWFVLGEELAAFEREFSAWVGAAHGVGVGNGTDALELAFRALDIGPGDEVLVPVNSAFPTATAVSAVGATPVFVDVDSSSRTMDPVDAQRRSTPRTRAIVPVHLYGAPADMDALMALASRRGLEVVEDAAQGHGTRYKGRHVGTLGRLGCFSFYPSKNLGAYGDGGLVVTSDDGLAEKLGLLRNYGQTRRYHHALTGVNSRLDELQAAVLRVKLPRLAGWVERRRALADRYRAALEGSGVGLQDRPPDGEHAYHLFVIRSPRRDALIEHLASRGIQALIHYPVPLHLQEAYRRLGHREGDFPVAEALASEIVSLPLFPELREDEADRVASEIREFHSNP